MKKSIKTLLVALFVSFAFVLSACGAPAQLDTEATVNLGNEADYAVATTTEVETVTAFAADTESADAIQKYRVTMDLEMYGMDMTYNAIIAYTETDVEVGLKLSTTYQGQTTVANMFYKDGVLAVSGQSGNQTIKVKATLPQGASIQDDAQLSQLFDMDLGYILTLFNGLDLTSGDTVIKANTEGDVTRFQITSVENTMNAKIYLIFETGVLTQCQMEMDGVKIVMAEFEGSIEFPNFDDYQTVDYADMFN